MLELKEAFGNKQITGIQFYRIFLIITYSDAFNIIC